MWKTRGPRTMITLVKIIMIIYHNYHLGKDYHDYHNYHLGEDYHDHHNYHLGKDYHVHIVEDVGDIRESGFDEDCDHIYVFM